MIHLVRNKNNAFLEKMREFNDWLLQNPDFITTTVPLGDGLAISRRKEGAQ